MELRDYQRLGVEYLAAHDEAGLFLDMGLGKTATTLSALTPDHLPALVVAPKRVAELVWPEEVRKWRPDLSVTHVVGKPAKRTVLASRPTDLTVVSRDLVHEIPRGAMSMRFRTLILDELSSFKTRSSRRWKAARELRNAPLTDHVWGLTGTPSPNGLMDLWAQVYLLDGGVRLGRTLTSYRNTFFFPGNRLPSGVVTEWVLRDGAEKEIHDRLTDLCLYMSREDRVELPPVTYNTVMVELPPRARSLYRTMKNELAADIRGQVFTAATPAIVSNRLSQIAAGFLYPDLDEVGTPHGAPLGVHREKIAAIEGLVEEALGSPVLVFYRYRAERNALERSLPGARTIEEPGVIDEWNAGKVPVLLAHPASAGHGLNLQFGGHTIVWTSPPWSSEEWEQGNARLIRSGQTSPVTINVVLAAKTIDLVIRERLDSKISTQDALLKHLESPL